MFVAPLIGDLAIPQFPLPLAATILIGGIDGMAALFLLHPRQGFDRTLQSMSSLIVLTFTIVVSTVLVAVGFSWHRGGVWCAANGGFRPGSGDLLGGAHDRHHGDDAVCPDAVNKARCCVDVGRCPE